MDLVSGTILCAIGVVLGVIAQKILDYQKRQKIKNEDPLVWSVNDCDLYTAQYINEYDGRPYIGLQLKYEVIKSGVAQNASFEIAFPDGEKYRIKPNFSMLDCSIINDSHIINFNQPYDDNRLSVIYANKIDLPAQIIIQYDYIVSPDNVKISKYVELQVLIKIMGIRDIKSRLIGRVARKLTHVKSTFKEE